MSRRGRPGARPRALLALWAAMRGQRRKGAPSAAESLRTLPRLVAATASGQYRGTSSRQLALMALAATYVAVPFDALPEVLLPGVGLLDDGFVLAWLAGALLTETDAFLAWEREGRPPQGRGDQARGDQWGADPQRPSAQRSSSARDADHDVVVGEVVD